MTNVLMTSTKSFERATFEHVTFEGCLANEKIRWTFTDTSLNSKTAEVTQGFEIVCAFVSDKIDKACIQKIHRYGVKLIALRSAGYNNVDVDEAKRLGISVVRVPRYSPHAVAEFAVGLYLSLNRKIPKAHDRIKEQNFSLDGLVGHDVHSQTVGIIGAGAIGRCTAQIFRGFGSRVLAFDPIRDQDWAKKYSIDYVTLEELLQSSDVVSIHAPLTPASQHLLDIAAIFSMKRGGYLINTSRGAIVDTDALLQALKTKHLGGAALDVYEEEENIFFKDHSEDIIEDDRFTVLSSLPNVLVTSHQAFLTQEALNQIARTTIDNILKWAEDGLVQNTV